jgi:hypothetical protein
MTTINEILRTFGPEYVDHFGDSIPYEHRKTMDAIIQCRTQAAGVAVYACEDCGQPHMVYQSCRKSRSLFPLPQNQKQQVAHHGPRRHGVYQTLPPTCASHRIQGEAWIDQSV